ncbi:MAG: M16 family metallopeptidase [Myxococcota bacterium]
MIPLLAMFAFSAVPATAQDDPEIPYEKYELDNGLDVILAPDTSTPIVYVSVWYHVGSKDEKKGLTGFAHLFEHLMFQGSLSVDGEYFGPLQEVGASINGTTSFDRTNYFELLPAQHLPLALFMESDRMGSLLPVLDEAKLNNQRDVVKNERRQRYENPPYGEAYKDVMANLYPEGHPYHHMPIGSHADLTAASLDDVKAFFNSWYLPNNASLVIAGDFDPAVAKVLVVENFAGIPKGPVGERPSVTPVTLTEPLIVRQTEDVPEQRVWMAWHSPAFFADGDADLDLLSSVLSEGKESRLYQRLVKEKQIAKSIRASQSSGLYGSRYMITATAAPGHTTDEIVAEVKSVIDEVRSTAPPTADEIAAGKAGYERYFYESLLTIQGKGETLQRYNMYHGDPGYMGKDLARYRAVTPDSVKAWADKTLTQPHFELHISPGNDDTPAVATDGGAK